jgi:hypothetical protein
MKGIAGTQNMNNKPKNFHPSPMRNAFDVVPLMPEAIHSLLANLPAGHF